MRMGALRFLFSIVPALALAGCIVAPCPKGMVCDGPVTGSGGSSGSGADSGIVGSSGTSGNGTGATGPDGAILPDAGPHGSWINSTGTLANMPSDCGNMASLGAKPDEDLLIAGISLQGLWGSTNGGETWRQLGTGADSGTILGTPASIVFDPVNKTTFWQSVIYAQNGGIAYRTDDDGESFVQLGDLGLGHEDVVSIDFSDPERKTLVAGGHERKQWLYRSTDGGRTWANVGLALPADSNFSSYPLVIDSETHLVGCAGWGGGTTGIFRTTDGGKSWVQISSSGGMSAPLWASDGSIYWASPDGEGMVRSTDKGLTFTEVTGQAVITSTHPIELPDGRIATIGPHAIVISADHGATWRDVTTELPFSPAEGLAYSPHRRAFYVWHNVCDQKAVPADAIMRYDFDYERN